MPDERLAVYYLWIWDGSKVMLRPRKITLKADATVRDLLHQVSRAYMLPMTAVDIWKV